VVQSSLAATRLTLAHQFFMTLERLKLQLLVKGFDLVQPFDVEQTGAWLAFFAEPWARALLPTWLLEELRTGGVTGLLIGNSRLLWERFLSHLESDPALKDTKHPLDQYSEQSIKDELSSFLGGSWEGAYLGFAHQLEPCALPMQRLAAHSGLAHLAPCGLAIHATYGPWMALRAVVFLAKGSTPVGLTQPSSSNPAPAPCDSCAQPCMNAFKRASGLAQHRPPRVPETSSSAPPQLSHRSRLWLEVRNCCPVGREQRYGDNQITYHYDKLNTALRKD